MSPRRFRQRPLADRLFARAVALGATSEHVSVSAVDELRRLAGGDGEALSRALARCDHPSGEVGHPRTIATALLRSAIDRLPTRRAAGLEALEESGSP
jgi:hypothetical protein